MTSSFRVFLLCSLSLSILGVVHGQQKCKTCLANQLYCLSPTTFDICLQPNKPANYHQVCPSGTFCSDSDKGCVASHEAAQFPCGKDDGQCGVCFANDELACVDRTHFTLCSNRNFYLPCKTGEVCNIDEYRKSQKICINEQQGTPTCQALATTTQRPVISTPSDPDTRAACEDETKQNPFAKDDFYIPNPADEQCKSYIYCKKYSGNWSPTTHMCATGYFNYLKQSCDKEDTTGLECGRIIVASTEQPGESADLSEESGDILDT